MSYLQIFKRIIPFFLTFAAGLLIASIFVPITGPSFRSNSDRSGKWRHHREVKQENENLRRENDRLRQELNQVRLELDAVRAPETNFGDFPIEMPATPPPPRVHAR